MICHQFTKVEQQTALYLGNSEFHKNGIVHGSTLRTQTYDEKRQRQETRTHNKSKHGWQTRKHDLSNTTTTERYTFGKCISKTGNNNEVIY